MLQITVTVCEELSIEQTPTLTLNVPDRRNEEMVIATLARLARKGFVTEFKSKWIK
jgi:hypothetical protein